MLKEALEDSCDRASLTFTEIHLCRHCAAQLCRHCAAHLCCHCAAHLCPPLDHLCPLGLKCRVKG